MARTRQIKPGFFLNEQLGEASPLARLLFAGLWCIADRRGRLHDRPRRIHAEVLPYDDVDVDALLQELADLGFIVRYEIDGSRYIEIPNFERHQHPHPREQESEIPPPTGWNPPEAAPSHGKAMPVHDKAMPVHGKDVPSNGEVSPRQGPSPAGSSSPSSPSSPSGSSSSSSPSGAPRQGAAGRRADDDDSESGPDPPTTEPLRDRLLDLHRELSGRRDPPRAVLDEVEHWLECGVTAELADEARAELDAWEEPPKHPWAAFAHTLGELLARDGPPPGEDTGGVRPPRTPEEWEELRRLAAQGSAAKGGEG